MLEPVWARSHAFDLMHVHFGFDQRSPEQLQALVRALASMHRPLVLTVHDLRSPHQLDPAVLEAQLDVLVPSAAELVTLTETAARVVSERWGRSCEVVPHPHVVDLEVCGAVRARRESSRQQSGASSTSHVGVALKSLRTNTDGARLLPALSTIAARGHRVTVTMHRSVLDADDHRSRVTTAALRAAHDRAEIDLVVHDPLDDRELWAWIATVDVAVLPYRFGTHSGWLEMCHDLATSVVAPSCGHYAAQGADATYDADEHQVDASSLVAAVESALDTRRTRLPGRDAAERLRQRHDIAATHDQVYARARSAARRSA